MNTLEKIRKIGYNIALENEIFVNYKIEDSNIAYETIDDFIERIKNDFFKFQTLESFDPISYNLFGRAFMYVYGKGAEFAFFSRLGNQIPTISYNFDKAMHGICGENLPDHFLFNINRKSSTMLEMYAQMFNETRGAQEKMTYEGIGFCDCISTILIGAFICGNELGLKVNINDEARKLIYIQEKDSPYDYNSYNQTYKVEDFKIINYSIRNINDNSADDREKQ